jgi:hypothetical protein
MDEMSTLQLTRAVRQSASMALRMALQLLPALLPGRGNAVTPAPLAVECHRVVGSVRVQGASSAQLRS